MVSVIPQIAFEASKLYDKSASVVEKAAAESTI